MSAHVLLNLLKELGKRDKMRGLSSISSGSALFALIKMVFRDRKT